MKGLTVNETFMKFFHADYSFFIVSIQEKKLIILALEHYPKGLLHRYNTVFWSQRFLCES